MKISVQCPFCGTIDPENFSISDKITYAYHCKCKERCDIVIENPLFDILFEIGIYSLKNGFYRDAISTMNTALERFFEFCSKLLFLYDDGGFNILQSKHLNFNLPFESEDQQNAILKISDDNFKDKMNKIENFWKPVKSSSERQYGVFLAAYLAVFKESLDNIHDKKMTEGKKEKFVERRNRIVHQGAFSSYEEAVEFGNVVQNFIKLTLNKIEDIIDKSDFSLYLNELCSIESLDLTKNADPVKCATHRLKSYLNIFGNNETMFDDWLKFTSDPIETEVVGGVNIVPYSGYVHFKHMFTALYEIDEGSYYE